MTDQSGQTSQRSHTLLPPRPRPRLFFFFSFSSSSAFSPTRRSSPPVLILLLLVHRPTIGPSQGLYLYRTRTQQTRKYTRPGSDSNPLSPYPSGGRLDALRLGGTVIGMFSISFYRTSLEDSHFTLNPSNTHQHFRSLLTYIKTRHKNHLFCTSVSLHGRVVTDFACHTEDGIYSRLSHETLSAQLTRLLSLLIWIFRGHLLRSTLYGQGANVVKDLSRLQAKASYPAVHLHKCG